MGATDIRSIDEVMGWEPVGDPSCPDGWIRHDGTRVDETAGNRPDVDDMLAWLRSRGYNVDIDAFLGEEVNVMPWNSDNDYPDTHEAAVRAVAA